MNLLGVFDMFQLVNRINEPPHLLRGVLDLIVTSHDLPVLNSKIFPCGVYSDHSLLSVTFPLTNKCLSFKTKLVRSWKRMDESRFISLVQESCIVKPCDGEDVDTV